VATVLLLAIAACSGDDAGEGTAAGDAPDTLQVWRMGDSTEEYIEMMDSVTEEYQEQYPDTEVEVSWIPWGEFAQRFQTALVDGGRTWSRSVTIRWRPGPTPVRSTTWPRWAVNGTR
jgi:N,N'-diacetylchitobiose transport system substrate-binding protein